MITLDSVETTHSRGPVSVDRGTESQAAVDGGAGCERPRESRAPRVNPVRSGSDRRSVQGAARATRPWPMSRRDERALADQIKAGDEGARNQLILENLMLVRDIVRDYKDCGLPLDDLIQEGNLGLIRASQDFDPITYVSRFRHYASFWIRISIHRALAANISLIRCSEYMGLMQSRYRRAIDELGQVAEGEGASSLGQASLDEIAERMGVSLHTLQTARQAPLAGEPHHQRDERGERVALDELPTVPHPPESDLMNRENDELVHRALSRLSPFEAWVICERYGFREPDPARERPKSSKRREIVETRDPATATRPFQTYYPRTLGEIGLDCGLSVHRVRLVEKTALDKLRKLMNPAPSHAM